jgi:hypothetical protein
MAEWQLKSLQIEFREWGEYAGKYTGTIQFTNKSKDAFVFQLNEAQTEKYLQVVADQVGFSASELGDKIKESMKLLMSSVKTIDLKPNE